MSLSQICHPPCLVGHLIKLRRLRKTIKKLKNWTFEKNVQNEMALLSSQLYSGHEHGGSEGARVKTQGKGGNKRTRHPTRLDLGNCGERFLVPPSSPRFDERTNNRSVRINAKMRWRTSIFTQRRERFLVRERFLLWRTPIFTQRREITRPRGIPRSSFPRSVRA